MSQSNEYNVETFFPFKLVEEVIDILKEKNCTFIRYADLRLNLVHPRLDRFSYLFEYISFSTQNMSFLKKAYLPILYITYKFRLKLGLLDFLSQLNLNENPVVILQHDADAQPYKTIDMMKLEEKKGVVSSNYFFKNQYQDYGNYYNLDIPEMQAMESKGFEIGYHLNAHEHGDFNLEKSLSIAEDDIAFFKRYFDLRTFVPHGNNHEIPYTGILRDLPWCYNGKGFSHNHMWSDGNVYSDRLEDPREVALRFKKGERGLFLMHPQYYGDELSARWKQLPFCNDDWWMKLWKL